MKKDNHRKFFLSLIPYLLVAIFIILSFFTFPWFLFILIPIFAFFNLDSRILIMFALLLLGLGFYESFANQLATLTYGLLVVGIICIIMKKILGRKQGLIRR
jgi:hypothetical protein